MTPCQEDPWDSHWLIDEGRCRRQKAWLTGCNSYSSAGDKAAATHHPRGQTWKEREGGKVVFIILLRILFLRNSWKRDPSRLVGRCLWGWARQWHLQAFHGRDGKLHYEQNFTDLPHWNHSPDHSALKRRSKDGRKKEQSAQKAHLHPPVIPREEKPRPAAAPWRGWRRCLLTPSAPALAAAAQILQDNASSKLKWGYRFRRDAFHR